MTTYSIRLARKTLRLTKHYRNSNAAVASASPLGTRMPCAGRHWNVSQMYKLTLPEDYFLSVDRISQDQKVQTR